MNYQQLWRSLTQHYEEGEAKAIARMVFEVRYGLTLSDLLLGKDTQLSANDQKEVEEIARRLLLHEPVQYILGRADFCGRSYHVAPGVLIPRPETEELCRYVIAHCAAQKKEPCHILDIGTGSGCIAITLAAEIPDSIVTAWDISEEALQIAQDNAQRLGVHVNFEHRDILKQQGPPLTAHHAPHTPCWDIISSNPPYILYKERERMEDNVLNFEPHTALFVPDNDPLLFYRAIAETAQATLKPAGILAVEINRAYGSETCELLKNYDFNEITLHKDSYHNNRFIIARR